MSERDGKELWKKEVDSYWERVKSVEREIESTQQELKARERQLKLQKEQLNSLIEKDLDAIVQNRFRTCLTAPVSRRTVEARNEWLADAYSKIPAKIKDIPPPLIKNWANRKATYCREKEAVAMIEAVGDPGLLEYLQGVEEELAVARKYRKPKSDKANAEEQQPSKT